MTDNLGKTFGECVGNMQNTVTECLDAQSQGRFLSESKPVPERRLPDDECAQLNAMEEKVRAEIERAAEAGNVETMMSGNRLIKNIEYQQFSKGCFKL